MIVLSNETDQRDAVRIAGKKHGGTKGAGTIVRENVLGRDETRKRAGSAIARRTKRGAVGMRIAKEKGGVGTTTMKGGDAGMTTMKGGDIAKTVALRKI